MASFKTMPIDISYIKFMLQYYLDRSIHVHKVKYIDSECKIHKLEQPKLGVMCLLKFTFVMRMRYCKNVAPISVNTVNEVGFWHRTVARAKLDKHFHGEPYDHIFMDDA